MSSSCLSASISPLPPDLLIHLTCSTVDNGLSSHKLREREKERERERERERGREGEGGHFMHSIILLVGSKAKQTRHARQKPRSIGDTRISGALVNQGSGEVERRKGLNKFNEQK